MRKLSFLLLVSVAVLSSCNSCFTYSQKIKQKQFDFVLEEKSGENERYAFFAGRKPDGTRDTFSEVGFKDMLEFVKLGDTMRKIKDKPVIMVIRERKYKLFYLECDGQRIK